MNTEIICITDRSGSMNTIRGDVIGGFNSFLADQKTVPGEARITFTQFDDQYEVVYQAVPLADAPNLKTENYVPRGGTALLDAIGRTINEQAARIAIQGWAEKVIVCIITDGQENRSQEFAQHQIKKLIEAKQEAGWAFIFLAANQDAFAVGRSYGISGQTTRNFTANAAGTAQAYGEISSLSTTLRTEHVQD